MRFERLKALKAPPSEPRNTSGVTVKMWRRFIPPQRPDTTQREVPGSFQGCRSAVDYAADTAASAFALVFDVAIAVNLSSVAYSSSSVSCRIAAISVRPSWFDQAISVP